MSIGKIAKSVLVMAVLLPVSLWAQDLGADEEIYLRDPDPRYHGEQVETLQRFLLFHGMNIGTDGIDGWFGKDTDNALRNYQFNKGQEETGRIKVRDFSGPLVWNPYVQSCLFSGWMEGPFPGNSYEDEILPSPAGKDLKYSSYFGTLTIGAAEIKEAGYSAFVLSPAKRFAAALNGEGTSLKVWDILSGTEREFPIEETAKDSSYQWKPEEHGQFRAEEVFWWMNPMKMDTAQLTLVISFTFTGPNGEGRSLFLISPYI